MSIGSTLPAGALDDRDRFQAPPRPARALVLFESSAGGAAALREAAALSGAGTEVTVVTLAPQAVAARCCQRGPGVEVLNCVVRDEAANDLCQAREQLGAAADAITFSTLIDRRDPPLREWAAAQNFDLIVLPSRRGSLGGHPLARRLRRATRAELRLVR
ncbi:MAG: hypothetical protein ABR947_01290 [Solirubrobacteraceae bacterium]|jgi:nucleotide-binding universal stress UspA family protein